MEPRFLPSTVDAIERNKLITSSAYTLLHQTNIFLSSFCRDGKEKARMTDEAKMNHGGAPAATAASSSSKRVGLHPVTSVLFYLGILFIFSCLFLIVAIPCITLL